MVRKIWTPLWIKKYLKKISNTQWRKTFAEKVVYYDIARDSIIVFIQKKREKLIKSHHRVDAVISQFLSDRVF